MGKIQKISGLKSMKTRFTLFWHLEKEIQLDCSTNFMIWRMYTLTFIKIRNYFNKCIIFRISGALRNRGPCQAKPGSSWNVCLKKIVIFVLRTLIFKVNVLFGSQSWSWSISNRQIFVYWLEHISGWMSIWTSKISLYGGWSIQRNKFETPLYPLKSTIRREMHPNGCTIWLYFLRNELLVTL